MTDTDVVAYKYRVVPIDIDFEPYETITADHPDSVDGLNAGRAENVTELVKKSPDINQVEDPAAVLAIPESEDVAIIRRLIETGYNKVSDEYTRLDADEMDELVARQGSLCQELLGQLNDQEESSDDVSVEMSRELAKGLAKILEYEVENAPTLYSTEETMESGAEAIRDSLNNE